MTGTALEAGLSKDQGQAGPGKSGMLNPYDFGGMTETLEVRSQWWGKPSSHNGLPCDCRHGYREAGNQMVIAPSWMPESQSLRGKTMRQPGQLGGLKWPAPRARPRTNFQIRSILFYGPNFGYH